MLYALLHQEDSLILKLIEKMDIQKQYFLNRVEQALNKRVKILASQYRTRIEMRQIGVRDVSKMLGGLGICGRPFCCSQFLDDFHPVSIKMAKEQNISLNPSKIINNVII